MNVTDITKQFQKGDLARANLFKVQIPYLGRNMEFKVKASSLPVATVEKVPLSYQNKKINLAGDRTFEDWTVTVYVDVDHEIRNKFIDWQNLAQAIDKQIYGEYPDTYKKTATITQINRQGKDSKSYTLYGIWPTSIQEAALDWDNNNQILTFDVTFAVDYWLPNK